LFPAFHHAATWKHESKSVFIKTNDVSAFPEKAGHSHAFSMLVKALKGLALVGLHSDCGKT
jgi:hypothetical protein